MSATSSDLFVALARSDEVMNAIELALKEQKKLTPELHRGMIDQVNGQVFKAIDRAEIVFIDLDPANEPELSMLKRLVAERRGRGALVATVPESCSLSHIRQIVRAGIDDVVPQPLSSHDVRDALEICRQRIAERTFSTDGADGQVIGFMRGRGGAGTSTLALNTAIALTKKKRRKDPDKRVLMIDLDLQFGDDGFLLDLEPRNVMVEIIRHPERLDQALLQGAVVRHEPSGLDVLQAPQDPVPIEAMGAETVAQLIELARAQYDYVVIDMPPALTTWLEPILSRLSKLYLVTRLNVPSIRHTRRLMDVLAEDLMGLPVGIVLNRHVRRFGEGGKVRQGAKALGHAIDHIIPEDTAIAKDCADSGTPVVLAKPRSKLGKAIVKFTATVTSELATAKTAAQAGVRE